MLRFRTLALLALGVAVPSTMSCTAILAPRDDVQRCGSGDDCKPTGDERYVAACVFDPDNLGLDVNKTMKICVADFDPSINCAPADFAEDSKFAVAYEDLAQASRYAPMDMACSDLGGVLGCPPAPGGTCLEGLTRNDDGICDDGSGTVFSTTTSADFVGQDVRDQFCRSFFCDESFVCDSTSDRCAPCDPDAPFGQGGCGELYISGAKSCVYQDAAQLKNSCAAPDSSDESVAFGCE